ncbi:hypothetical protein A8L44_04715 [Bacillus sp. FJAT-27986]|nr:hypothetical protein A8L44_04715 [Bacillus sp. FJAT-27986]
MLPTATKYSCLSSEIFNTYQTEKKLESDSMLSDRAVSFAILLLFLYVPQLLGSFHFIWNNRVPVVMQKGVPFQNIEISMLSDKH